MVADLSYTLTPPVEWWCLLQRWKRCQNEKENWRIVPAIRRLDTSAKIQFIIIIVGCRTLFQVTLKCLQNPIGEGSKDFSTLNMFFIIVLFFLRNVYKSAGCCSTQLAQCRYQLLLIQLCFHWWLTLLIFISSEKKPTTDSQHSAPFVDCFMDFFPHNCKEFHQSPWANTSFSFLRKKIRRE